MAYIFIARPDMLEWILSVKCNLKPLKHFWITPLPTTSVLLMADSRVTLRGKSKEVFFELVNMRVDEANLKNPHES